MLSSKAKRELKKNQRRILIDSIEIGIPSPQQIYTWGERQLPNGKRVGEIKNSKTVNYKRFTPLRDGLFCERIFGPVNSFVCACGKRQPRADVTFCDKCEVEYTDQRTRRYRLGYIPLVSPVAHVWYLKGRPSYLSLFLGKRKKKVIALAYCNAYLVEQAFYQTPGSSRHLAPTDVMSHVQEREAHGVNRYTKNIQSSAAIRHISNMFYNSPKSNLHTDKNVPVSSHQNRLRVAEFVNPLIKGTTANKNYKKDESTGDNSPSRTKNGVQYSAFNHFQKRVDKKTSPSLFYHLLGEVLGYIKKDIVLTDSSKKEITHTDQSEQIASPLTKQVSLIQKRQNKSEGLLSLRPLWGYTCSEQSKQDLHKFSTLLNRGQMGFGLRQENSMFSKTSLLLHRLWLTKEWDFLEPVHTVPLSNRFDLRLRANTFQHSVDNLQSYKEFLNSTPTVFTLIPNLTSKKAFQAGFKNSTSQLCLRAIYEPLFTLPIDKWLDSIFIFFGKDSKKLYSYSQKTWQLRGSHFSKSCEKVFDPCCVPFSLFLMTNLHTKFGQTPLHVGADVSASGVQKSYRLRNDVETPDLETDIATVKEQMYKDVTSAKEKNNRIFSTCWPFEDEIAAKWQSTTKNLYFNENKKIKIAGNRGTRKDLKNDNLIAAQLNLPLSTYEPNLPITAQTPKTVLSAYNRAHTLPFLPSLICKYNLRDELLNLLNSSPFDEDKPIYSYCELERWQPLRDVHQFMSEQVLSQSTEGGNSQEGIRDDVSTRSHKQQGVDKTDVVKELASTKRFLNLITQSPGENSPDLRLNGFDSKSKKINGFSLQNKDQRAYAARVRRICDSARDAGFIQAAEGVTKEYTLLEKLASLRHILYIALLEKDSSLRAKKLTTRARRMSCLLISISREKLIHKSIHLSPFTEIGFKSFVDKGAKHNKTYKYRSTSLNSTRSTQTLNPHLYGSKMLGKRIRAAAYDSNKGSYQRFQKNVLNLPNGNAQRGNALKGDVAIPGRLDRPNPDFDIATVQNKSALTIQSKEFLQSTRTDRPIQEVLLSRRLRLRGKRTSQSKHVYPFHYLLRKFSSKNLFVGKIQNALSSRNAAKRQDSNLQVPTRVAQPEKMSSLVGLANILQLKSPERSYRSLLFDRTWVRSFLLEKHLLDKNRYSTICVSKLLTSSKTQRGVTHGRNELTFKPQISSIPSYIHAFRQHANNKNQFNGYALLIRNTWSKKTVFNGIFTSGLIEPVTQTAYVAGQEMKSVGKKIRSLSLGDNGAQHDCNVLNNTAKKSVGAQEKRLINRVYNLTFVVNSSDTETLKEASSTYQLVPPFTKFIQTLNPIPSLFREKFYNPSLERDLFATANSNPSSYISQNRAVGAPTRPRTQHGLGSNLSDEAKQEREILTSSALSFFLILPYSHKVEHTQTLRSVSTEKAHNTKILDNLTSLQRQLKNGNSELLNKPQIIFDTFSHHIHTGSVCLQLAQTSFYNTSKLLKESNAESASLLSKSQLATRVEAFQSDKWASWTFPRRAFPRQLINTISSLNGKNFLESSQTLQSSTNSVYRVPAAYRYNNSNDNPLFGRSTSVSGQNEYVVDTRLLQRGNAFIKTSPPREIAASPTQQDRKRVSTSVNKIKMSQQGSIFSSLELTTIREILSYTGGGALYKLLQRFDTQLFATFLFADIKATRAIYKQKVLQRGYSPSRIQKRILTRLCRRIYKNSRRLKIAQLFTRCKRRPEWMMISVLPVLPPDLRPILQMSESVVVASDLNNLYQRVVYRNNRFYKLNFIDFYLVTAIQRLVQDAVDRLIENGKGGSKPFYTPNGRPLKSLSDTLKGKKGRFRLNLLGKRVDFSGRSVIVVSPSLKIHECGLPREIALELYHYFLLRQLMLRKQASSIIMAKKIIQQRNAFVWDVLRDIVYHHPVLLNRAPTLHRLGIQAFQPKLVKGNAILLNPLVCSGFNADFDGDQMGVHLPLSTQARAEAWDLLWSRNNLLSPATGQPVLVPSQDMVLGFYYMTQSFSSRSLLDSQDNKNHFPLETKQLGAPTQQEDYVFKSDVDRTANRVSELQNNSERIFSISRSHTPKERRIPTARELVSANRVFFNCFELLKAFQNKNIYLHTPVWLQWQGKMENDEGAQTPLELRINSFGSSTYIYSKYKRRKDENLSQSTLYIRTTAGRVLVNSILFK